jgi:penicillin V acylase-like amidase (Ntn superfamily)
LPPEEWFSPNDGLAAVQALIAYLRDQLKALKKVNEMLAELQEVEAELSAAKRAKVKFHFSLVP